MSNININIPTNWNELSDRQLYAVLKVFKAEKLTQKHIKKLFRILMGCRWFTFKKNAVCRIALRNIPASELQNHFNWLFKTNTRTDFIAPLKLKKVTYQPPMAKLLNLTSAEYADADDMYYKWFKHQKPEYLYFLAAILYTPYPRPEYNRLNLEPLAATMQKVPLYKLEAIAHCYAGCKSHLTNRYKKVFKGGGGKGKYQGFRHAIQVMTGSDLSKETEIAQKNIYTFLDFMQADIEMSEKHKTKRHG